MKRETQVEIGGRRVGIRYKWGERGKNNINNAKLYSSTFRCIQDIWQSLWPYTFTLRPLCIRYSKMVFALHTSCVQMNRSERMCVCIYAVSVQLVVKYKTQNIWLFLVSLSALCVMRWWVFIVHTRWFHSSSACATFPCLLQFSHFSRRNAFFFSHHPTFVHSFHQDWHKHT